MELACKFDDDNVHLEGDSLIVVTAIAKKEKGIAPIHSLYDHVFNLCLSFNNFTLALFAVGGILYLTKLLDGILFPSKKRFVCIGGCM